MCRLHVTSNLIQTTIGLLLPGRNSFICKKQGTIVKMSNVCSDACCHIAIVIVLIYLIFIEKPSLRQVSHIILIVTSAHHDVLDTTITCDVHTQNDDDEQRIL